MSGSLLFLCLAALVCISGSLTSDKLFQSQNKQLYEILNNATTNSTDQGSVYLDMAERLVNEQSRRMEESAKVGSSDDAVIHDLDRATSTEVHINLLNNIVGTLGALSSTFNPFALILRQVSYYALSAGVSLTQASPTQVLADAMLKRFQEVNQKLNGLQNQLSNATERLAATMETQTAMAPYRQLHLSVRSVAAKMRDLLDAVKPGMTQRQLSGLIEEFTRFYESSQLERLMLELHFRATRARSPLLGPNLFEVHSRIHHCSTSRLLELFNGVAIDYGLGSQLHLAYQLFRNGPSLSAADSFRQALFRLNRMRSAFYDRYWYCLSNTVTFAMETARTELARLAHEPPSVVAENVLKELQSRYHSFNWAVFVGSYSFTKTGSIQLSTKSFFELLLPSSSTRKMHVIFADKARPITCDDINSRHPRLEFYCPTGHCGVAAAKALACSSNCRHVDTSNWIALPRREPGNQCLSPATGCNGRGECLQSPLLSQPLCLCETKYAGRHCEVDQDPSSFSLQVMADMRNSAVGSAGLKTTVDVYYQLLDVKKSIEDKLNSLSACIDLGTLIRNEKVTEAMYIADTYSRLLKSEITQSVFVELMTSHIGDRNLEYFVQTLHKQLSGRHIVSSTGLVGLYKRCLSRIQRQPPCTRGFVDSVQNLTQSILVLNEAVSESLMTYISWTRNKLTATDRFMLKSIMGYRNRSEELRAQWRKDSCPGLSQPLSPGLENWGQRFCSDSHSFEGVQLAVQCSGRLYLTQPTEIFCRAGASGSRPVWSDEPRCIPQWGEWSPWSDCSVTCGGGIRKRRRCLRDNCTQPEWAEEPCNPTGCCDLIFGVGGYKRCASGSVECVRKSHECNGENDCSDGSDEAGCTFIKSGDSVILRRRHDLLYLRCRSRSSWFSNWYECDTRSESDYFTIYLPDKSNGHRILSGDKIALDWSGGQWLSCDSDRQCTLSTCPGRYASRVSYDCPDEKFVIYQKLKTLSETAGRPIRSGAEVWIGNRHSTYFGIDMSVWIIKQRITY